MADLRVIPRHDRNLGPDRPHPSCLAGMRGGVVERIIRPDQHREQVVEAEWSRDAKDDVVLGLPGNIARVEIYQIV